MDLPRKIDSIGTSVGFESCVAFPDHCSGSAARCLRSHIFQLVSAHSNERSFLFGRVPIGECGSLDLEGEGLVRQVDGVGDKPSEALRYDRLVFLQGTSGAVVGGEFWKGGSDDR